MTNLISSLISSFRAADAVDVLLLSVLIYWILLLTKGTRALSMLIALGLAIAALWLTSVFRLHTTGWLLTHVFSNLPLIIIVLFQHEIRRVLTQLGKRSLFTRRASMQAWVLDELVKTCVSLSKKKIGALMVIEHEADVGDFIELEHGHRVDARVSRELILAIFMPSSPIHDGAITIRDDRITRVGCFLPLTMNPRINKDLGTRHRAAIGITEMVDVLVLVVSEETGHISAVKAGNRLGPLDQHALRKLLTEQYLAKVKVGDSDTVLEPAP